MNATAETDDGDPRDRRINRAIFDYHQAVERGEAVTPEQWIRRTPEIADELRRYFDDLSGVPHLPLRHGTIDGLYPGAILGDYVILEKLGQGGQGVVWKASPRQGPEIIVALKTMVGPTRNDPDSVERFRNDARALARMNHPHIVRTSFVGEENGLWFIVMELIEGGTVAERLQEFPRAPRAAAQLVEKVARAIHHAHTRNEGVIHLDLKPGNILLSRDGEPKVTDFGLAVRAAAITQARRTSEAHAQDDSSGDISRTLARAGVIGTLPYLSTEMARGCWDEVSTLSDVYGLGAVLYTMLTARPPFASESTDATLQLVIQGNPVSPCALNPQVDRELGAICLKCLAPIPSQRYGSADALANDLRRWLEQRPTLAAGRSSPLRELRFWIRRHPLPLALAGALMLTVWIASLAMSLGQARRENADDATQLARQLDRELTMIRLFTEKLAATPELRSAWVTQPDGIDTASRKRALQSVLDGLDLRKWFEVAGGNPLVNILLLDAQGVELADTMPDRSTSGRPFHMRDYFHGLFDRPQPPDYVHVARSFQSIKDHRHKIAVSTRVWSDEGECLGVLVANFTIGPKLLGFDLRSEAADAAVLCPRDRSDPTTDHPEEPAAPWRYAIVLDRHFGEDDATAPEEVVAPELERFQREPQLPHAAAGPRHGRLLDYHRVGSTHLVVLARRPAPWPLSWWP